MKTATRTSDAAALLILKHKRAAVKPKPRTRRKEKLGPVATILQQALATLALPKRWIKDHYRMHGWQDPEPSFCALGVISEYEGSHHNGGPITREGMAAANLVADAAGLPWSGPSNLRFSAILNWNDAVRRRKEDVLTAFEKALETAKKKGL